MRKIRMLLYNSAETHYADSKHEKKRERERERGWPVGKNPKKIQVNFEKSFTAAGK